eukprot:TRINITY_DN79396_c0_g1_i1.p1 TRINITY_DN79396_c0_g1~~TRINITY_DN79396_c0_g1_i1.p1  ORF type:complete len:244 (+),score=70.30 TRINITY_DN79396_c0_g1_i1:200-931(+)
MGNCCVSSGSAKFEFTPDDGEAIQPTPAAALEAEIDHPVSKSVATPSTIVAAHDVVEASPQRRVAPESSPNRKVSKEEVKQEEEQPNAEYYYKLGKSLEKGPKADPERSFESLLKAAEMGHTKAALRVAYCYDVGTGVKQDAVLAAKWYRAAAESEPKAQFSLGLCYAKGLGLARDDKEAVHWFRRAADAGYERALYNLGYCYEMGTGVERDTDKALEYYQQAASKGSDLAKKRLQLYGVNAK